MSQESPSKDSLSNVYPFPAEGVGVLTGGEGACEAASAGDGDRLEEMRAILSCLQYLYDESLRLDVPVSAHLIGAAAESLRAEIREIR